MLHHLTIHQNWCTDTLSLPRRELTTGKAKMMVAGLGTLLQASTKPWQKQCEHAQWKPVLGSSLETPMESKAPGVALSGDPL